MDAYADALGLSLPKPARVAPAMPAPMNDPPAQPGMTGRFIGSPDDVVGTISQIRDPQERANAMAALEQQMRANGGQLAAPAPKVDPYADALGIGGAQKAAAAPVQAVAGAKPAPLLQAPDMSGIAPALRGVVANQVTGLGANIVGGFRGLATLATGGTLDDAANNVRSYVDSHTYTPQQGTAGAQGVEGFSSPANPVNAIPHALDWAGGKVSDLTGSPALGTAVNAGGNLALLALGMRGKPGTAPVEVGPARPATGGQRVMTMPQTVQPTMNAVRPRIEAEVREMAGVGQPIPQRPQPAAQQAPITPAPRPGQAAAPGAPPAGPATPYSPFPAPAPVRVPETTEAVQAMAQTAPAQLFPETPTISPQGKFGPDQQTARARILESVGIDPNKLRKSALAGDAIGGSTDHQTAKVDSPAGREMRSIIEGEKQSLTNHADTLISDTGGTHGTDQSALYARGSTIISSLDSLKSWYDTRIQQLYKTADERAPGVPTTLETFRSVLGDDSHMTNSDRVHLRDSVNAYARKLDILKEDGSVFSNGQQAETMRKYLNENWSPSNGKFVSKLKDALDDDIMKAAGEDVYAEARAMRTQRGATLDNPNGIAKLMDSSGPDRINRSVQVEKIADHLTGMPVDQFSHVVDTLKNAPPEVQPQAAAAMKEIKAQFANKVKDIGTAHQGQWNARGVTRYLQDNAARLAQVFTPQEIAAFRNLNDAGHIVAKDQSYPGAAVQGHNLITQGVMHGLPTAGAALGGAFAGPAGAAVGAAAGRMAAGSVDSAVGLRAVKKRTTRLADLPGVGR